MKDTETVEDLGTFLGKFNAFMDGIQTARKRIEKVEKILRKHKVEIRVLGK